MKFKKKMPSYNANANQKLREYSMIFQFRQKINIGIPKITT